LKSLRSIYDDYRAHKFLEELSSDWGSVVFYRGPGMILAWLLTATSVTPNMVTTANAFILPCMIAASIFLVPATAFAVVTVLALIYLILDCTDGALARATGLSSNGGHYLDLVTDIAYRGVLYVTVGYIADQIGASSLPLDQATVLAVSAWLATFARLARKDADRLSGQPARTQVPRFTLFSFLSGLDTVFPILAFASWSTGYLSAFTLWIFVFSLGDAVTALIESRTKFS